MTERNRMEKRFGNKIYRRFVGITQFMVFSNNNEYDDSDIEPIQGLFMLLAVIGECFLASFVSQRAGKLN